MATPRKQAARKQPSGPAQKAEPEVVWAIMRMRKWETAFQKKIFNIPVDLIREKGSIGFVEVFDTYENAETSASAYGEPTEIVPLAKVKKE